MAKASAGNGTKIKKSTSACPNFGKAAHTSSNSAQVSYFTKPQVRSAIAAIDISSNSTLMRMARWRAFAAGIDAEDLLQEAILRALTSRNCPCGIKTEHFLMGAMRSIASEIIAKRERREALCLYQFDQPVLPIAPDEACEFTESADAWRQALDSVIAGSQEIEKVIDGIDQGLCGRALAEFANTDQARLASVRKSIKRRVARACAKLNELEEAA
ncbi:sigma-70 RNA polymerase sigma factor region 4 domain-containing protein [Qipengyuania sp. 483]